MLYLLGQEYRKIRVMSKVLIPMNWYDSALLA